MDSPPRVEEGDAESSARIGLRVESGHEPGGGRDHVIHPVHPVVHPVVPLVVHPVEHPVENPIEHPVEQPTAAQIAMFQHMSAMVITQVLRNIPQLQQAPALPPAPRRDDRTPLEQIKKLDVVDFKGDNVGPMTAEDWLDHVNWCMGRLHFSGEERVDCVQGLLKDQARRWWDNVMRERHPVDITWPLFLDQFEKKYVSERFKDEQRRAFLMLKQGRLSVTDYEYQFSKLERYAREIVDSEERRCKRFDPAAPASSCSSVDKLREALLDEKKAMYERYAALFALRNNGGDEAVSAIIESLGSNSALLKHEVAYVLGQLQNKAASATLGRILRDANEHPMVRHEAAEALGSIADEQSVSLLEEFSKDAEPIVSQSCEVALSMLEYESSGKSFEYLFMQDPLAQS